MTRQTLSTSNLGSNVRASEYLERQFLDTLNANYVFYPLGEHSTMGAHMGNKARWIYYTTMATVSSIGTEGNDPSETAFTTTTKEATLFEWGGFTNISRWFSEITMSGTTEKFIEGNAQQAAIMIDTQCQISALANATNTNDVGAALAAEDLRVASAELHGLNIKYHPSTPGGNYFPFIGTPAALFDMMGEGSPAWFQAKSSDLQQSFVTPFRDTPATAALYDVICKSSTNIQTASSNDVMYMLGDQAFGTVALGNDAAGPGVTITPAEQMYAAPVRNRWTVGWWILFATTLLNPSCSVEVLADT